MLERERERDVALYVNVKCGAIYVVKKREFGESQKMNVKQILLEAFASPEKKTRGAEAALAAGDLPCLLI